MLADVQTYLKSALDPATFKGVEVVEEIDALADRAGQVASGTVIVMPWRERAQPNPLIAGGVRQLVTSEIAVGLVIRHYDQLGAARATAFDDLKGPLERALCGWTAPSAASPLELIGGEGSPVSKGVSIYVQTWSATRYLTGDPQ